MILCLQFATLCAHILMVSAGAPEDSAPFCTGDLFPDELPSHAAALMDSYNYLVLLGDEGGAVWQQVDLDTNNMVGRGTEVSFVN